MRQILGVAAWLLLVSLLVLGMPRLAPAKHAQHFIPADVLTVSDIPFPATTVAAGVVTLAINLDGAGQITNVQALRDIPTVTGQAMLALQNWTYAPASKPTGLRFRRQPWTRSKSLWSPRVRGKASVPESSQAITTRFFSNRWVERSRLTWSP
jgi:hypothetical protein